MEATQSTAERIAREMVARFGPSEMAIEGTYMGILAEFPQSAGAAMVAAIHAYATVVEGGVQ